MWVNGWLRRFSRLAAKQKISHRPTQTDTDILSEKEPNVVSSVCFCVGVWLRIRNMDINEITYQIRGAVFEVNRVLGAGFLEKVYEKALIVEFHKRGLKAEGQVPITVKYKDEVVGEYFADIVVEDKIIIELKAVHHLQKIHEAQLLNYLKATGYNMGLLINFTHPKAEIKRFVV